MSSDAQAGWHRRQSANPSVLVALVKSRDLCVRVGVRVSRSRATENTYTSAPLVALFKLSVVIILSCLHEFRRVVGVFSNEILD